MNYLSIISATVIPERNVASDRRTLKAELQREWVGRLFVLISWYNAGGLANRPVNSPQRRHNHRHIDFVLKSIRDILIVCILIRLCFVDSVHIK